MPPVRSTQEERAQRRAEAGLPTPSGDPEVPRKARSDGRPLRSERPPETAGERERPWRQTRLPPRRGKRDRALERQVGPWHGLWFAVEACDLSGWGRRWCRSLYALRPSEGRSRLPSRPASQPRLLQAPTRETALSQHCCAANVSRRHSPRGPATARGVACPVIATRSRTTLAAQPAFEDPADPSTAAVDSAGAKGSLRWSATRALRGCSPKFAASGRQDARSESTAPNALDGSCVEEPEAIAICDGGSAKRRHGAAPNPG